MSQSSAKWYILKQLGRSVSCLPGLTLEWQISKYIIYFLFWIIESKISQIINSTEKASVVKGEILQCLFLSTPVSLTCSRERHHSIVVIPMIWQQFPRFLSFRLDAIEFIRNSLGKKTSSILFRTAFHFWWVEDFGLSIRMDATDFSPWAIRFLQQFALAPLVLYSPCNYVLVY